MRYGRIEFDGFDWDDGNIQKIEDRMPTKLIEDFFTREIIVAEDLRHSLSEARYIGMGYSKDPKRCMFVAFTFRKKGSESLIRVISARFTHKKEEDAYNEQVKNIKKK